MFMHDSAGTLLDPCPCSLFPFSVTANTLGLQDQGPAKRTEVTSPKPPV